MPKPGEEWLQPDVWDLFDPQGLRPAQRRPPSLTTAANVYVLLECWQGSGPDEAPLSFATSTIEHDGLNPHWNEQVTWEVPAPAGAVVRASLYHKGLLKDELLASEAVPLLALRQGYRAFCHLRNPRGNRLQYTSLLAHIRQTLPMLQSKVQRKALGRG